MLLKRTTLIFVLLLFICIAVERANCVAKFLHGYGIDASSSSSASSTNTPIAYAYQIKEFEVPVDHFNIADKRTFRIRYLLNDSHVDKTNPQPPVFFYTGNEGDIELFAKNTGFVWELAAKHRASVVFAEHRYYGKSLPFGADSFNTTNGNLGYFNVEQTLEDYADLITYLRAGRNLPIIAFGGSYGGMLAAWFRMKYPNLIIGALAASAPIWQFTDLTPCDIFGKITTSVYNTAYNSNCSENIRKTWKLFETLTETDKGRTQLSETLKLCEPIKNADGELIQFMDYLEDIYGNLAMANYPYNNSFLSPLPAYPVRQFCYYLKELHTDNTNLLQALHNALSVYTNFTGTTKCINWKDDSSSSNADSFGWNIQACSQMIMPMCSRSNESMFRDKPWDYKRYAEDCQRKYHLTPKPYDILQRYGGKNLETASNIIFSNGLLDPWSGGGVLTPPNNRIQVLIIPEGAHHLDLRQSEAADPASVRDARNRETQTIQQWIVEFYANNS